MTPDEMFIKTAVAVLQSNKLAGFADLLTNAKGFAGIGKALDKGGIGGAWDHLAGAYGALAPEAQGQLLGRVAGGVAGGLGGLAITDHDAGVGQNVANTALGAIVGSQLGGGLGRGLPGALATPAVTATRAPRGARAAKATSGGRKAPKKRSTVQSAAEKLTPSVKSTAAKKPRGKKQPAQEAGVAPGTPPPQGPPVAETPLQTGQGGMSEPTPVTPRRRRAPRSAPASIPPPEPSAGTA